MAILFPPIIESKIPAQAGNLKIHYTHNSMVGAFGSIAIKIKTISTNTEVLLSVVDQYNVEEEWFSYNSPNLNKGEFYKIQVAYIDQEEYNDYIGNGTPINFENLYWSSIGIFKWTTELDGWIIEINEEFRIISHYTLTDVTEPIYSYEIIIINEQTEKIIYQSKELYKDLEPQSLSGKLLIDIQPNIFFRPISGENQGLGYKTIITITTINGYTQSSELLFDVIEEPDVSSGCDAWFDLNKMSCFISSSETGTLIQYDSNQYTILGQINANQIFKNSNILPGEYRYCIRYDGSLTEDIPGRSEYTIITYSLTNWSWVTIDFEDMYLSDRNHLLCIRFNPKVGSFKETVLESKQDTIGGRYPFFFRNGNTKYKEFSINGLISYHMDNNETFLNRGYNSNILQRQSTNDSSTDSSFIPTTQLTGRNVYEEREFKLAVLEWLNNGRPKLFRSPTEGAYLVRLMNISLSPEDQLGRMLHSFQATAYEIDECTLENLKKYECLYEEE